MKFSLLTAEEIQLFRQRMVLILAGLAVCLAVLVLRLWYLQIWKGGYYEEVATGNRIRVIPQEAPRGLIYDRNGQLLAYNRPAFNIQLIPEDTPSVERSLENLAKVAEIPVAGLKEASRAKRPTFKFKPVVLLRDVGRKTADLVDTYQDDLPGISVAVESKRLYPTASLAAHVLGYVGAINEEQLQDLPLRSLYSARIVGRAGVELVQNQALIGVDGGKQVEVDHVGRELRPLSRPVNPSPGSDIYLTIDMGLQSFVRRAMGGESGVAIVMKPRTGEVLAMASLPDYDPNAFVGGISDTAWTELTQSPEKPLINKAVQGLFPPGSTFKMLVAAAALDAGVIDEQTTVFCPGHYKVGRDVRFCWKRSGHGNVALREALEKSCDVYFYHVGLLLGVDRIREYGVQFGMTQPTGIELESEKGGLLPSRDWKQRVLKEKWYDGETLPVSIGQGYVSQTPLGLLNSVNVMANRGVWVRPTIIHRVVAPDGSETVSAAALPRGTRLLTIAPEVFDVIREGMEWAVSREGTAGRARSRLFDVAGKTGTSQVVSRRTGRLAEPADEDYLPHAFFVGFAPAQDPRVSVLVLVEHGESGGGKAAPIARAILEYYHKHVEALDRLSETVHAPENPAERFRRQLQESFAPAAPGPGGAPSP
jgi:penicillin-binding protein 2